MQIVVADGHENITAEQKFYFDVAMAAKDPNVSDKVQHACCRQPKTDHLNG